MSEYLSKEEIKQWRSSLEKITLEEYAARLGKKIEEAKPTNDLIDIVLKGKPVVSNENEWKQTHAERLSAIAERSYDLERDIAPSPFSIHKFHEDETPVKPAKTKTEKKSAAKKASAKTTKKSETAKSQSLRDEVRIVFKKTLTDREQKVFDYFA